MLAKTLIARRGSVEPMTLLAPYLINPGPSLINNNNSNVTCRTYPPDDDTAQQIFVLLKFMILFKLLSFVHIVLAIKILNK